MNLVIRTTFLAIMAVAISQPVQAGKFKDFFTSKTDKEVKSEQVASNKVEVKKKVIASKKPLSKKLKPARKESWFKRTFSSKKANSEKIVVKKKLEKKPKKLLRVRKAEPGLGRVPGIVLASNWVPQGGGRKSGVINSEQELDAIALKQANARKKSSKQAKIVRAKRLEEKKHANAKKTEALKIKKAAKVKAKMDRTRAKAEAKVRKAKMATAKNDVKTKMKAEKKSKKGNWFTRTFKSDKDSKK